MVSGGTDQTTDEAKHTFNFEYVSKCDLNLHIDGSQEHDVVLGLGNNLTLHRLCGGLDS